MAYQIFVRSSNGTTAVDVAGSQTTVGEIKEELAQRFVLPEEHQQILTFGFSALSDEGSLETYGITAESTIFCSLALLGGGKKRKKKQYTKPKKTKHKKKKVKLSILKFYKVDSNEKVSRLRKECPEPSCGAGVFMAMHHNRTYCGRCGLTYIMKKDEEE
eukprot:GHVQ01004730.1.p2 GENE.GHVQ01004730.1~~GHVQ01004730.1.p2  ORF type:complete len:160 (+),score=22.58 GHVQ01004730.1:56-535(+)